MLFLRRGGEEGGIGRGKEDEANWEIVYGLWESVERTLSMDGMGMDGCIQRIGV